MAPKPHFDAAEEIPSLDGKIVLVSGGTAGLGRETIVSLAAHGPSHIYFTGRNQSSANQLIKDVAASAPQVPVSFIKCDLASLESVVKAARELVTKTDRLDIVFANAGVMALPPGLTADGYEIQFGTNHVGHALLVKLLTPLLNSTAEKTGDVRVVWTTSLAYGITPKGGIAFDKLKTDYADASFIAGSWLRYGQSKLANLLYARMYAKYNPTITSVSIHPGISATNLVSSTSLASRALIYVTSARNMVSPEECAWNQQWAATAPKGDGERQVQSGVYYEPVGIKGKLTGESGNDELAERLWTWTQDELSTFQL